MSLIKKRQTRLVSRIDCKVTNATRHEKRAAEFTRARFCVHQSALGVLIMSNVIFPCCVPLLPASKMLTGTLISVWLKIMVYDCDKLLCSQNSLIKFIGYMSFTKHIEIIISGFSSLRVL